MSPVKALLFDVQGTATDFHSTVSDEARRIGAGRHPDIDWSGLVRRWRAEYFAALDATPAGGRNHGGSWVSVRSVYRRELDDVLDRFGASGLTATERDELTSAWQKLKPWPDVLPGLNRLKPAFTLATLSNADVCSVVEISKRAGLPWDAVFAAEMAGVFKPDPAVYRMAARYLGLEPAEIMMVASHKYDLRAAGGLGFRTAFVARPLEFGAGDAADGVDTTYEGEFEVNAADFLDLAGQLGC